MSYPTEDSHKKINQNVYVDRTVIFSYAEAEREKYKRTRFAACRI